MRLGICSLPQQAEELAAQGWDYVEWPMRGTVGSMSSEEYAALRERTAEFPTKPEAWNVMLPQEIGVVGPDADLATMEAYLRQAMSRATELGGEVVVFGSGGSRHIPEGWSQDRAREQFVEACRSAGDIAAEHGVTIAIEPLNPSETNLVNSVAEGAKMVRATGHPSVRLLSDLYHVVAGGEPVDDTARFGGMLVHVHVATPTDRKMPTADLEPEALRAYVEVLRDAGYDGRVSVECGGWELADAAVGLAFLRSLTVP
ncbi:MAG: sugar phosphate isomerase/epimerase [Chloroflexota bacterium]|nr:sugar phosphate isomerase/epimerase [Chloroflexota bacterium]